MYENFYQLTAEPFRLSPDPRYCFQHRTYRKAMTYMRHALHRAEGFIMITGRPGTGKTTLIQHLLRMLKPGQVIVANLVTTQMTANDLIHLVAYAYNLNPGGADKVDVLVRLDRFLKQQYKQGRRSLLIVDEAQDMSDDALEELRLLTNIQAGGQQLLQIFLVGQEQLRDVVNTPSMEQLHQRMIAATHLETLDCHDTEAYIKHRLRRVAWTGDPLISKEAYAMIQQHSQGIPRQINQICSRLFLHGSIEEKHRLGIADLRIVVDELREELLMPIESAGQATAVPWPADPQQETYEEEPRSETQPAAPEQPATPPSMHENEPASATSPTANNIHDHRQQAANTDREPGISTAQVPFKQAARPAREPFPHAPPEQASTRKQERPAVDRAVSRGHAAEERAAVELTVRVPDQETPGEKQARKQSPWGLPARAALITGLAFAMIYAANPELTRVAGQDLMAWVSSSIQKDVSDTSRESSLEITEPVETTSTVTVARELPTVNHEPIVTAAEIEAAAPEPEPEPEPDVDLPKAIWLQLEEELQLGGLLVERMGDDILKVNLSSDGMFAFDSAWIKGGARPALQKLADVLRNHDDLAIQVVGHTDSYGAAEYNLHLSERRAKAVADLLISQGLTDSSIQSEGRGDHDTRLEDPTSNAPELKRRVEIYIRRVREG